MYKARYCLCSGSVRGYMSNLSKKHWEAMKGITRYLIGTRKVCIWFRIKATCVEGYTDADYAGDLDKRRSTSGYIFMFARGAVSWRSRLQSCTSMSQQLRQSTLLRERHARKLYGLLG